MAGGSRVVPLEQSTMQVDWWPEHQALGAEDDFDSAPYGVPLAQFLVEFPFVQGRVDVEMDRCPGAVPRIVVWLDASERRLALPHRWHGFQVDQRPPLQAVPLHGGFGAVDDETILPPQVDKGNIPAGSAQEAAFPVGVAVVIFGVVLAGFVVSFYIKRTPTGRWTWQK